MKFGSFRIESGALSPYYIDLSCLLSSPVDFCCVVDVVADEIERVMVIDRVAKLASIELKGARLLPSITCRLKLPCVVVRKVEEKWLMESVYCFLMMLLLMECPRLRE